MLIRIDVSSGTSWATTDVEAAKALYTGVVGWGTQAAELYLLAPSSAAAAIAVAAHGGIGGHEGK